MVNLNTNIPLMGQGVNVLGNMAQGTQLASQQIAMQDAAQRKNLFAQHGAGMLRGDQNALNALAGVDPMAALQMRSQHEGMAISQERIAMAREQTRRALAEAEDQREAQREAQEAVTMGQRAMAALQSGDERAWSMMTREFTGGTPLPMSREGVALLQSIVTGSADYMAMVPEQEKPSYGFANGHFYDKNNPAAGAQPIPGMPESGPLVTIEGDNRPQVGSIPQGYMLQGDAETGYRMAPIPGGPADTSANAAAAAEQQGRASRVVLEDISRVKQKIETAPWYNPTTGLFGDMLSSVGGTPAFDVGALLQTIGGNIGFDRLQQMRDASPTGGALGAINQQEMNLLMSVMGSLEQAQSENQLLQNLDRLAEIYTQIMSKAAAYPNAAEFGYSEAGQAPAGQVSGGAINLAPSDASLFEKYGVTLPK